MSAPACVLMWRPSAISAIEPNSQPPAISASIMTAQSQMTAHARRSLLSYPSPRNTWLWNDGWADLSPSLKGWLSFEIGSDDVDQLVGRFGVQRAGVTVRVYEMHANVVLDHFGHQPAHRPTCGRDKMHDRVTAGLAVEGALYRLDLAANT